ncbi:hypothetical protein AB0F17_15925 [Nonomuraea sp. NPDC026600]|uniref:hypothetical protein n=1 Tax=Nonomuraea sp. NPDC026600 TaxID=3155363 RepID=UPI0033CC9A40
MDPLSALALAAAVVAVIYLAGRRNPLKKCGRCGGRGMIRSWVLPWRFRPCPGCDRSGEIRARFGRS